MTCVILTHVGLAATEMPVSRIPGLPELKADIPNSRCRFTKVSVLMSSFAGKMVQE
jgi:hypothetical protein